LLELSSGRATIIGGVDSVVSVAKPAFAPDSQQLLIVAWSGSIADRGTRRQLLLSDRSGKIERQLAAGQARGPAWNAAPS
jgi:hypothetical protein